MITPNSTIQFLNAPFSSSQNNVLKFSNINAQNSYFEGLIYSSGLVKSGCAYQREGDGEFVRVGEKIDEMYKYNYCRFQNPSYGSKWFYAFISKVEYVNSSSCRVYLEMDVFQTYQFDYVLKKSFIDRQTFNSDYYNTLADTPSTGDLKTVFQYEKPLSGHYFVLFNADPTIEDTSDSGSSFPKINNFTVPCYMAFFDNQDDMSELILSVSNKGRADRIQACYFAPVKFGTVGFERQLIPKGDLHLSYDFIDTLHDVPLELLYDDFSFTIDYNESYKKELAYPYAKLEIVDRITGKYIELDISKFSNPKQPSFRIIYNFTGNVEYKVIPLNYNGQAYSVENAFVVHPNTDLPIFSNTYGKYLKDNTGTNLINGVMSVAGAVGSIATGNVAGAVGSFGNIAGIINADNVARKQPNQVSGLNGDGMEYVNFSPSIYFRLKVMDSNHMDIARNFWKCYGYPVRKITDVNMTTSPDFVFVKTEGVNIESNIIPSIYLSKLENIFNNGVTIWNRNYLEY